MISQLRQLVTLTIASMKMYYRNVTAVFFSLFFPLLIIAIFGLILHNGANQSNLAVVDEAHNASSKVLIQTIEKTKIFKIATGSYSTELKSLQNGDQDLITRIPSTFNLAKPNVSTNKITAYYDKAKAQNAEPSILIINNFLTNFNEQIDTSFTHHTIPTYTSLAQQGIETNNLNEIDFLVPGVIAFSIMQGMLFGVAFGFTTMKKTGALKRLEATPAKPFIFLLSQSVSRLILSIIQMLILLYTGIIFFHLHMYGSFFLFLVFVFVGSLVFLSLGFAVAGYAKDENQAAPLINLISLPMTFLSGVFFPRSLMPDFLKNITGYLPLTYLSDALRQIANNGAGFNAIKGDLLGLTVWVIIAMILAVRLFKWE